MTKPIHNLAGCIELAIATRIDEHLKTLSKSTPSTTVLCARLCMFCAPTIARYKDSGLPVQFEVFRKSLFT